jgi:glycosyltransferase involved in cell wall biosynthesis
MRRDRVLLLFDEHYTSNGQVVFASVRPLLRQLPAGLDYQVICRGSYRGPRFDRTDKVRVFGHPVERIGEERGLLARLRRKIARFRVLEADDRWMSNVDAASRPVLRALFAADRLHAVVIFTTDPNYALSIARLTHIYATAHIPHIIVVTSAAAIAPAIAKDLCWLNARVLHDGHPIFGPPVLPGTVVDIASSQDPAAVELTQVIARPQVASPTGPGTPLAFMDPEAYPSRGLEAYRQVDWRRWIGPEVAYPRRVRDVVLFIRPDWMVCGSGTTFESLARWFRDNDALMIDVGLWPYAVPFRPAEVAEKLVQQETHLGSALYFSLRESNSVPHILGQFLRAFRWRPVSVVNQVMLFNTRAAKPRLMREAIRRAKISHIYVNHYFTYLFAESLIAGRKFFLDTHDVQAINFVHNGSFNIFTHRADKFGRLLADEMRIVALAERACFVSLEDMQLAARFMPREKLDFIIALPDIKPCRSRPLGRPPRLLVVASNNAANQRSLAWMFDQVLPALGGLIAERIPNAAPIPMPEIHVCGSIASVLPPISSAYVKIHGVVPDLRGFYERADIVLLPVITGGGVAIKTIEALLYGRPVVATRHAMRGLPETIMDTIACANEPMAFAGKIANLLRSERLREQQTAQVRRAAQLLHAEGFYDRLSRAMDAVRLCADPVDAQPGRLALSLVCTRRPATPRTGWHRD